MSLVHDKFNTHLAPSLQFATCGLQFCERRIGSVLDFLDKFNTHLAPSLQFATCGLQFCERRI